MKKFLFGCTVALTGLTMPLAADYCCPSPCESDCYAPDFNGLYIGGNLGVYSNSAFRNDYNGFFGVGGTTSSNSTNFTAGIQLGYDWECYNKVFGVVGDWSWVNNRSGYVHTNDFFDWYSTIRARGGLTVCDSLVYLTLGAAVMGHSSDGNSTFGGDFSSTYTRWGWVGGAGTEFTVGCGWSVGAEFLVLNFSNHKHTFTVPTGTFTIGHSDTAYVGRVLLNYRLGNMFGF